jgi:NAD(P)-dependent dehydrogenase (short-subunit alcohol dehydrogenase family)
VTGGASGIGLATCKRFASEGGQVAIVDLDPEHGKAAEAAVPGSMFVQCDIGVVDQVRGAVDQVVAKWGRVDILVNNAAMMTFDGIDDIKVEEWDHVMAVNLRGAFLFAQACLKTMKNGAIVNVSSVHAHETTANVIPYATSKGGIESFCRALSREIGPDRARVNCVAPGAVNTPMLWNNPNVKDGKESVSGAIGQPEDLAAAIAFMASDDAKFVHGTTLIVDGGRLDVL